MTPPPTPAHSNSPASARWPQLPESAAQADSMAQAESMATAASVVDAVSLGAVIDAMADSMDSTTDHSAHSYVLEMMGRARAGLSLDGNDRGYSYDSRTGESGQGSVPATPRCGELPTPFATLAAQTSGLSSDSDDHEPDDVEAQRPAGCEAEGEGEGEGEAEGEELNERNDSAVERVSHASSRRPSLPPVDELRAQLRRMRSDMPPQESGQPGPSTARAHRPHPRLALLGTAKATRKDSPIVPNDNADDPMAKFRDYRQQIGTRSAQSLEQQNRLPPPRTSSERRSSGERTTRTVRRVKPTPTVVRAPAISPTDRADSSKVDISIELPPSVAPTLPRPEGDTVRARLTRRRRRLPLPWVIGFGMVSSCALVVALTGLGFTLYNFSKLRQNRAQKGIADLESDLLPILANMTNGINAVQAGINILLSADVRNG